MEVRISPQMSLMEKLNILQMQRSTMCRVVLAVHPDGETEQVWAIQSKPACVIALLLMVDVSLC